MDDAPPNRPWPASQIWVLALWSGIVMGLGESLFYFMWQAAGKAVYVSADILWAAMGFDVVVCLVAAAAILVLVRVAPRLRPHVPLAFAFLLFTNWVAVLLHEYIQPLAFPVLGAGLAKVFVDLADGGRGRLQRWVRRSFPWVATIGVLAGLAVPVTRKVTESVSLSRLPEAPADAKNVLVLLIDTFRADHSSTYGYDRETTPRIDDLAVDGVLFEWAFATASYTLASHASLMTGLLPHQHRAEWVEPMQYWDCGCPILGEELQDRGYATAGFSSNPYWFTREYGFARGFHHFEDFFNNLGDAVIRTTFGRAIEQMVLPRIGYLDIPGRKHAEFVNGRVLDWIGRQEGRPFYAFVNYFDIHDPYLPPEPYRSRFADHPVGGLANWRISGDDPRLTDEEIVDEMAAYDGAITYVDEQIGALLDSLETRGLLENTIVVVTSDHGEAFGEHGLMLHGHSLYTQTTHVPLIIVGPGVPAGMRVPEPVSNAALPSTLMWLALGEHGFPWSPLVGAETSESRLPMTELVMKPWGPERFPATHGAMQSVIDGRWHYIRNEAFGSELYDIQQDPAELTDLYDDPANAEIARRLDDMIDATWGERASSTDR